MSIELSDALKIGVHTVKATRLEVVENIQLQAASDPEDDGLRLEIVTQGWLGTYREPETGTVWTTTNSNDIAITAAEQEICSVQINQDVTPTDGSYSFICRLDSTSGQDADVKFSMKDDAAEQGSQTVHLARNAVNHTVVFSGPISSTLVNGSMISIDVSSSSSNITVSGSITSSKLDIKKAAP